MKDTRDPRSRVTRASRATAVVTRKDEDKAEREGEGEGEGERVSFWKSTSRVLSCSPSWCDIVLMGVFFPGYMRYWWGVTPHIYIPRVLLFVSVPVPVPVPVPVSVSVSVSVSERARGGAGAAARKTPHRWVLSHVAPPGTTPDVSPKDRTSVSVSCSFMVGIHVTETGIDPYTSPVQCIYPGFKKKNKKTPPSPANVPVV